MPVYNEEYGTDWGKVLPEIGNQISSIIKNKREKPGLGAQQALEIASTNPDMLKPENEATLAQLLGANYTPEGVAAARSMAASPYFQEVVKAKIAGARMPGAQLGATEAGTTRIVQETAQMPDELKVKQDIATAQVDAAKWEHERVRLTMYYGDKDATRAVEAMMNQEKHRTRLLELESNIQTTRLAIEQGSLQGQAAAQARDAQLKMGMELYKDQVKDIGEWEARILDPKFKSLDDETKAVIISHAAGNMAGLINAQGALKQLGVGVDTQIYMARLLQGMYFGAGQNLAKFEQDYQRFLGSLGPEEREIAKKLAEDVVRNAQIAKDIPGANPYGLLNPAGKVGLTPKAWDAIASLNSFLWQHHHDRRQPTGTLPPQQWWKPLQ